jgi:hypothetical protein
MLNHRPAISRDRARCDSARQGFVGLAFAVTALVAAAPASAQWGPRFGLTVNPDQVHAGLQVHAADMTRRLSFMPSFEVGAGDELVSFAANMDLKYVFTQVRSSWVPYAGGGPSLMFFNPTNDRVYGDSSTDVGVGVFGGLQTPTHSGYFFTEMRLGLIDIPDLQFTVGWQFLH